MNRGTWFHRFVAGGGSVGLAEQAQEELSRLDSRLFTLWNLGDNVLLGWTHAPDALLFLLVRHYAIPELVHGGAPGEGTPEDTRAFVNELLSGPKYLEPAMFDRVARAFQCEPKALRVGMSFENDELAGLVSDMVRCYGVSLVRNRAVVLLDAVQFSVQAPLDQLAMLNSLAYSVNSAYGQLLSKNIKIDFARTTTGDGFYIWNRATTADADNELYKLMMMLLADNAAARAKARGCWVPHLRAAFHVGEHYEFHQVVGLNPTHFSYIVGQVTVDLARMLDRALPGQILIGDFDTHVAGTVPGRPMRQDTLDFIETTAATLDQLNGLEISGGRVETIRCYLTGRSQGKGHYSVDRFHLRDKHNATRTVYNAKINIHRESGPPVLLGIRGDDLSAFDTVRVEAVSRNGSETGSFYVRP